MRGLQTVVRHLERWRHSRHLRHARHVRSRGALAAVAVALCAAAPVQAQIWTTGTCGTSSCHSLPPTVRNSVADGAGSYVIGLGESWMTSATTLRARAAGAGAASVMTNLSAGDANLVWAYFKEIRDGTMGAPSAAPSFAAATVGASTNSNSFSFTLTNFRNTALNYAVGFSGTHASDFAVQSQSFAGAGCTSSTQLPAATSTSGAACTVTVTVRFTPSAAGTRNANLKVTLSGLDGSDAVPLDGADKSIALSATAAAPVPGFQISTAVMNLSALVGNIATSSDIIITNPSSATGSLVLSSLVTPPPFSGAGAAAYSLVAPSTNACALTGMSLAPGASCRLAVRFTASAKGTSSATLNIAHNASGSPQAVALSGTALQGTVGIAASIAVGGVPQGSTGSTTAQITNAGDASLTLGSKLFSGTGSGEFSASGCTAALAPAATCTLTVNFTPTGTTARSVTLALASNGSNSPTNVTVTATGTALASPTVSAVAAYPSTLAGTTSTTTRTLTITNPRSNPLDYSAALSGARPGDFAITAESCPTRRIPGGGAGSCTLTLSFSPANNTSATSRAASLDLVFTGFGTDPSPATQSVALAGTAQIPAPAFSMASSTINFSAVVGTPGTSTATITNSGTAALVLGSLTFGGTFVSDYALAAGNACTPGLSLPSAPGSNSCTLAIQFNPASAAQAAHGATLSISHNAAGSPQVLTLAGTATPTPLPAVDVGGAAVSFGSVPLGSSATRTVTVSNIGAAPLLLSSLGVTGAAAGDYTRSGTCTASSSIAVGGSCTVVLVFAPGAAGARAATLAVGSNASNTTNATVSLAGDGTALADPVLSPTVVDPFPLTLVGSTSGTARVVTISNPRPNALTYAPSLAGGQAGDFTIAAESCPSRVVAGGGTCTLTLQYAPTAPGARSATLNVAFTGFAADPSPAAASRSLAGTAALPAPVFSIASGSLVFTAVVGTPGISTTVVTNTGSAALSLSALTFSGVAAAEFSAGAGNTCTAGTTLAPSTSCVLAVRYAPVAAGNSTAQLTVVHNAAGSPQTVSLAGTATPAPQGRVSLGALSLTFPSTLVGSAAAQDVTVQNTGDAPLVFSALTLSGAAAADFTRSGSCSTAAPLAVAAQCTVSVNFVPSATGSRAALLTLQSNASNGTVALSLAGTGVPVPAPAVTLSTPAVDFGQQTLGGLYPTRAVTVTNTGTAVLSGLSVVVQGAGFAQASTAACPPTLAPGAGCVVDVRFTPGALQAYSGSLSVNSNAAGAPHVTTLSGGGTAAVRPALVWAPAVARLDFGNVAAGTPSAVQSATLLNQGPGGVTLTLLNAVGAQGSAFSVTAGTCVLGQPLFEGQSCRVDVVFAPGSAGARAAAVQVASTGNSPPELALAGTGLGGPSPALALSSAALAFDVVRVGTQSLPAELTLRGSGAGVVRILEVSTTGPYSVQMKSCPALPISLPAGSDCTVAVSFNPQTAGSVAGTLRITTDANPALQEVALGGTGQAEAELSSGGCSMARGDTATDPTLWLLLLGAVAALLYRRRARRTEP